jgi:hypothetical protein
VKLGKIVLAAMALTAAAGAPHKVIRKTAALDFSYIWPAEAVAIPALDMRFYKDAKAKLAEAQKNAAEDQALARQQKRDFNQHLYSMDWTTAGQTLRLLSLQNENGSFEGGAHPNTSYDAMLWDRRANRSVSISSLFTRPVDFAAITRGVYCKGLDAERTKRREGEKLELPEFNQCPKYSDLAIAPVDSNKNGRFDRIDFVASPYVAGPYVEGEYEIIVPVTPKLIAALKPGYRVSFEPQRQ